MSNLILGGNSMDTITLSKYHGLGNDYLVLDPNKNEVVLQARQIEMLCRRNFGVGADGLLYGPILDNGKIGVRIFNSDGSEAEKSGNGVRIFAKYLKDAGYVNESKFSITTKSGEVFIEFLNEDGTKLCANMGKASFAAEKIPVEGMGTEIINHSLRIHGELYNATCLSVGNPHCVIIMEEVSKKKAEELGPYVENADCFPNRVNMQLLKVLDRNNLRIEIYERGSGYTMSSGTSGCAAAAAAYRMGLVDKNVTVHMPGGDLEIEIGEDGNIYMTGTVGTVGTFTLAENFFS